MSRVQIISGTSRLQRRRKLCVSSCYPFLNFLELLFTEGSDSSKDLRVARLYHGFSKQCLRLIGETFEPTLKELLWVLRRVRKIAPTQ
jgi:hypothetical protein